MIVGTMGLALAACAACAATPPPLPAPEPAAASGVPAAPLLGAVPLISMQPTGVTATDILVTAWNPVTLHGVAIFKTFRVGPEAVVKVDGPLHLVADVVEIAGSIVCEGTPGADGATGGNYQAGGPGGPGGPAPDLALEATSSLTLTGARIINRGGRGGNGGAGGVLPDVGTNAPGGPGGNGGNGGTVRLLAANAPTKPWTYTIEADPAPGGTGGAGNPAGVNGQPGQRGTVTVQQSP